MGQNMGKAWSPLINRVSGANWVVWGVGGGGGRVYI